jgi:putative transposase
LADVFWHEIKHHSKNLTFCEFIVMPNHIHGILIINSDSDIDHADGNPINNNPDSEVQTRHALSLRNTDENPNPDADGFRNPNKNPNPQQSIGQKRLRNPGKNSISSIIGGYKSAVTKHAHRLNLDFEWQTRFYDNIIRDERAFHTISNYIINNIKKWAEDKFRT